MGVVIMQGVPKIFGALRGHLCDSIAFLLLLSSSSSSALLLLGLLSNNNIKCVLYNHVRYSRWKDAQTNVHKKKRNE